MSMHRIVSGLMSLSISLVWLTACGPNDGASGDRDTSVDGEAERPVGTYDLERGGAVDTAVEGELLEVPISAPGGEPRDTL